MTSRRDAWIALFLIGLKLATCAMVLPRPPSSPNHIRQDHDFHDRRFFEGGKSFNAFLQSTNVERPDTENYRLLEIEVQGADNVDTANLQGIMHAMLKTEQGEATEQSFNETYPNPEVVPHSILGVRNVGIAPNFRVENYDEDKQVLLAPPKFHALAEKLYYLKSSKPKVYVNVRGDSGAFRKDSGGPRTTMSDGPLGYLRVTRPFEKQTDWKVKYDKKTRIPKKFDRLIDKDRGISTKSRGQISAHNLDDLPTTEHSMVTSSELPKQIPAPPSKALAKVSMVQTTPVQRYAFKRTDILPSYRVTED